MNCGKGKGWKSWLMILGCLLPILIVVAAPFFGIKNQYLSWLAFLACPLAMMFMMMSNDKKRCH